MGESAYSLPVLNRSSEVKFGIYAKKSKLNRQLGVTLLRMLIVLAASAIVLTVIAPKIQNIVTKNQIESQINELSSIVKYAKFSAIDAKSTAIICASNDLLNCETDWEQTKIVFIDTNNSGNRDPSEPLLMSTTSITKGYNGPASAIQFLASGVSTAQATIQLCPTNDDPSLARGIIVSLNGKVELTIDANKDGVHEDAQGKTLSCE